MSSRLSAQDLNSNDLLALSDLATYCMLSNVAPEQIRLGYYDVDSVTFYFEEYVHTGLVYIVVVD